MRKLEFLMADARRRGYDCVITIGGIQSNHCRCVWRRRRKICTWKPRDPHMHAPLTQAFSAKSNNAQHLKYKLCAFDESSVNVIGSKGYILQNDRG